MRTYGTIRNELRTPRARSKPKYPPRPRLMWGITCEPHVVVRLKRVFERVDKGSHGELWITDTPENCREILWFLDRYPMAVEPAAMERLETRAREHLEKVEILTGLLDGAFQPREFPLALPPREYQRVAAEALLRGGGLLLADDVGLGKTATAICTFTDPRTRPALVVTLTHLPRQWETEIAKFAPGLRTHIVKSGKPYDIAKMMGRPRRGDDHPTLPGVHVDVFPDVLVINYHKLAGWADALAGKVRSVVFDECQELRRDESDKYQAARHIAEHADFRLGLSATPIFNYGGEIYNVLGALVPGALGTADEFAREWCGGGDGDKPRIKDPKAFGTYAREQGLMLRRTRSDVGRELPELTKVPHAIEADVEALDRVGASAAELARIILRQGESHRGEKMQASEELSNVLRQATGIAKAPYVAEFVRLLVESGERVVLFGWHREVYSIWLDRLKDLSPALYTGTESPTQKDEARRRFIDGETPILIMSLRSGAGLDGLQGACRTVVFGELDWSPGVHEQCIGRVHRDGQDEPAVAYFLISDHGADPIIADVLGVKRAQIDGIRDPNADVIERLDVGAGNVRRLAEAYLQQRGEAA